MKSPIALLGSLLKSIERLSPGVKGLDRDFITVKQRFENEGYGFLTIALPALDDALLQGLSTGRFACPTGFKTVRGGTIPVLFSGMFCEVFDPVSGILKGDTLDMCTLKGLHNLLRAFKKVQLSPENEALLHKEAVEEFYRCDESARMVVIPDRHDHLIGRVSKVLLNTLNSKDVANVLYRHGPGSVEEGYRANQKWEALSSQIRSGLDDLSDFGLEVQAQHHNEYRTFLARENVQTRPDDRGQLPLRRGDVTAGLRSEKLQSVPLFSEASRRNAKLITVAKNSSSRRTITMEPMFGQFIQQGLRSLLIESIDECKILRNSIALTRQDKNQVLALEGSLLDNWATIDLKSASDLLSIKLVESVFRHHGLFLDHMMDCRSTHVYSDLTEAKPMSKFAGMGNALTFPVQSVCFATVLLAAILDAQGKSPSYWNVMHASRHIRVYGDDIIVSTEYAHQCVAWLQEVGLKINLKKSFLVGNYKESCGVEGFRGVDITPIYIRHRPDSSLTDPNVIAGLVSTSNQLWMEGLYEASTCLSNEVEERLGYSLPLVSKVSGSLGWHSRIDASFAHKWCKRTHQLLVRAPVLKSVKRDDRLGGYAALLKFFCTAKSRVGEVASFARDTSHLSPSWSPVDHLSKTPIRFRSRIASSWVPARLSAG